MDKSNVTVVSSEDVNLGFICNCETEKILINFGDDDYDIFDKFSLLELYQFGGSLKK